MKTLTKSITPWLQQRQEILVTLHNLAGILPSKAQTKYGSLNKFFQLLINYVCAGHLQIFNLLINPDIVNIITIKDIVNKINNTTNSIMKYNYKFNRFKNISANDITNLLEQFADRIELEDLLLNHPSKVINKKYIN